MRLTEVVKQWLKEQEWEEVPEINEENQTSSTGFEYSVGDFNLNCFFDAKEKAEVFSLYMYLLDAKVPEKRLDEITKLVNVANVNMMIGMLHLLQDERVIRYYGAIDVENAAFEPAHISNMLNAGVHAMSTWLPRYMAVCFGGKTAEEALAAEKE